MAEGQTRRSYEAIFKLKVIAFAEEHSNKAAEREFTVSEKVIRGWRKKKTELQEMPRTKRAARYGTSPYKPLELELSEWVLNLRREGLSVTRTKALQLAPNFDITDFKASAGWCTRFMNRYGLAIREKTHIAQKLPSDIDGKVQKFLHFVLKEHKMFNFELTNIVNMMRLLCTLICLATRP